MTTTTTPRSADAIRPVGPGIQCIAYWGACKADAVVVCEVDAELLASYLCDKHATEFFGPDPE